jgi:2-polyprenyl-6-hydroxyphenyl methylase/3-demethylubiquinone-9 3-methyltransferase
MTANATVDAAEIARFAAMADDWWDPHGKFRPLHQLAPVRLRFIRDHVAAHFDRDITAPLPLDGLNLLDIGCGGGLLTEPMARLGARVTGVDAAQESIAVAQDHAGRMELDIDYRCLAPEHLTDAGRQYDVVLSLEVIEHVADVAAFLDAAASLVRPGGVMVLSTINRTLKALALAKVAAEYVLRWLPVGTHDWRKFVKPSEIAAGLRPHGVEIADLKGISYNPISDEWSLSRDLEVNYLVFAVQR